MIDDPFVTWARVYDAASDLVWALPVRRGGPIEDAFKSGQALELTVEGAAEFNADILSGNSYWNRAALHSALARRWTHLAEQRR